jgi:hypothetical protein
MEREFNTLFCRWQWRAAMNNKAWGLVVFGLGVFSMHILMTVNFWAIVIGIVPDATLWGIVSSTSLWGGLAWSLGPPIGAVLMVIGGFVHGRTSRGVAR